MQRKSVLGASWAVKFTAAFALVSMAAACAPDAPADSAAMSPSLSGDCLHPESGVIRPESPGLQEVRLSGPFTVKLLQAVVDPANPRGAIVFWSKGNAGILVSDFKGQLHLAEGETLFVRPEFAPLGVVYSGCSLK